MIMKIVSPQRIHSATSPSTDSKHSGRVNKIKMCSSSVASSIARLFCSPKKHPADMNSSASVLCKSAQETVLSSSVKMPDSVLASELEFLIQEKQLTQQQLSVAKSELAELSQQGKLPSSSLDVAQTVAHMLLQEKMRAASIDEGSTSRVYNEVLNEEADIQLSCYKECLKAKNRAECRAIEEKINIFYKENSDSRNVYTGHDYDAFKKHSDALNAELEAKNNEYKMLSQDDDNGLPTNISPVSEKRGTVEFLTKKLAMLEFSSKVTSLYQESSWSPPKEAIEKIRNLGKGNADTVISSADKLSYISEISREIARYPTEINNLNKMVADNEKKLKWTVIDKRIMKYDPILTLGYVFSKYLGNDKYNTRIKNASLELEESKKKLLVEVDKKNNKENELYAIFADCIFNQQKSVFSCDDKLSGQLAYNSQYPTISSQRYIDPASGLYHEKQFEKSGTCLLHATNHYLSAYAMQNGSPYLELTPKRLDLLLDGIYRQQYAKIAESLLAELQSPQPVNITNLGDILQSMDKGLIALGKTYIKNGEHNAVEYNYKNNGPTAAMTGYFYHTGIMNLAVKNLTPLAHSEKVNHKIYEWKNEQDNLLMQLQNNHNQLGMCYLNDNVFTSDTNSGHAMNFAKVDGRWYFQDSHFDAPIPCSPAEMIAHLNQEDGPDSPLNHCPFNGTHVSFRQHHKLNKFTDSIEFFNYSL
jgi:hypothetical protein